MSKKVLVVEDDEQINHVYEIKFKQEGYEVLLSTDGEDGFKKISAEKPNLVLLDLMLPGKDGFWVLQEKKKKPELKDIPVIVLSNLGQEQDKQRAMELGAVDYLVKADMSIKSISEMVKKYIK